MLPLPRCGIDLTEISRVRQMVDAATPETLRQLFSDAELSDAGRGPSQATRLAARVAAKEACLKLFPRETATGALDASDFSVRKNGYGAPEVCCSGRARAVLDRHGIEAIAISLSHTEAHATAMAVCQKKAPLPVPLAGKLLYHLLPIRRELIVSNLQLVYGQTLSAEEIRHLAQAHYGHFFRMGRDFIAHQFLSKEQRAARVRVENAELIIRPLSQGQGAIILTGHFGNFATAISAGVASFPEARGRFAFIRRPLNPPWFDALISKHFEKAGFSTVANRRSMEAVLDALEAGNALVFPFDQHTSGRKSVRVDFFGQPVGTFRSLALIALASGAPVFPAASWREANGQHVLRFEEPLTLLSHPSAKEEVRLNTRLFNSALERLILRHPEQWWWVHRRFRP